MPGFFRRPEFCHSFCNAQGLDAAAIRPSVNGMKGTFLFAISLLCIVAGCSQRDAAQADLDRRLADIETRLSKIEAQFPGEGFATQKEMNQIFATWFKSLREDVDQIRELSANAARANTDWIMAHSEVEKDQREAIAELRRSLGAVGSRLSTLPVMQTNRTTLRRP